MNSVKKRVLVGIDGSDQSFKAASYISEIMPPEKTHVVLFNVDSDIRELYFDTSDESGAGDFDESGYVEWMDLRKQHLELMMEKTVGIFTGNGFPPQHVSSVSRDISIGVARDLIEESQKGYDLIVVGKTGTRSESCGSMGSVTNKLLSKVFHIPIAVVEGTPETHNILVGFDDSKGSVGAIRDLPAYVENDRHIMLCHVIRSSKFWGGGEFEMFSPAFESSGYKAFEDQRIESQRIKMTGALSVQKDRLANAGVPSENIDTLILEGYRSRSQALVQKARKDGYGTIVLGRRGNSAVMEFFIGRVGRKVVDMCESMAVWIMN